jgi:hypothetical protein
MNPIVITTTSDLSKCYELKRSLIYHDWDYHFIQHKWKGFLDKIHLTYAYLKDLKGYTHFIYTDAWDTFAMAGPFRVPDGLLISAERACYPHPEKAALYPENPSPWKYVNGGGWCGEIAAFIKLYELCPPTTELNDQVWLTDQFLKGYDWVRLDYECKTFQTLGFCPEEDFELNHVFSNDDWYLFKNNVHDTFPAFIHGNGHTPMNHIYELLPKTMNTIKEVQSVWQDAPDVPYIPNVHKLINETFTEKVNANPKLKAYRDWIEEKAFGFGERSFLWMWKLLIDDIPAPEFLEIGVFRGQILGLIRMLSPKASITGITPLDSTDGHWESDYAADIKLLHSTFKLKQPRIIKGLSTDADVLGEAGKKLYDIVYIDGGHTYEVAHHDIYRYSSFVKIGGYLVIDDAGNKFNMPEGYFKGIEAVSKAVDELLPNEFYEEVFNVVHNRVFRRIK